jgi:hypothetical protein
LALDALDVLEVLDVLVEVDLAEVLVDADLVDVPDLVDAAEPGVLELADVLPDVLEVVGVSATP